MKRNLLLKTLLVRKKNTLSNPDYCNHGYYMYLNQETKDDLTSGNKPKGNKEFEALTNLKG